MNSEKKTQPKKRRTLAAKIANVLSYILVSVFFLVVLLIILVQTAPVQNLVREKVVTYLQNKLKTRVEIGKLRIQFPNSIRLQNVYLEDQQKDTLLYGGELKVDIDMLRLLKNEVQIKEIDLDNITAKIKRLNQDTVFSFQFIADAFMGKPDTSQNKDTATAPLKMNISKILVNNTHLIFKDVITGNDMDVFITHLDAPIKTFDINKMYFDIPTFTVNGLHGYFYQNEPLKPKIDSAVAQAVLQPQTFLQLHNSEIAFRDIDFDYRSAPTNVATRLQLKSLVAHPDNIDIKNGRFALKDITLDSSFVGVTMSNSAAPPPTTKQLQDQAAIPLITITSNNINIRRSSFTLNNTSMPVIKTGMDYGHMNMNDLNLTATNFFYNIDTLSTTITAASFKEKSGFVLNDLRTDFILAPTEIGLRNLYIETPGTVLRKDAVLKFPSLTALAANPSVLNMDLDFENSHLLVKDLLTFAPMLAAQPAFSNPSQTIQVNGKVMGSMSDLRFGDLKLSGLGSTSLYVSGSVTGLPDPKKFAADLDIKYLNTTRRDILSFVPKNTLPSNITLPETISASGVLKGNTQKMFANISATTSLGSAKINGTIQNMMDPKAIGYDVAVNASNVNLGVIMQNTQQYGTLSANFTASGKGTDPQTATAKVNGIVSAITLQGYTYRNVHLNGSLANKNFTATGSVRDANIDVSFDASGAFNGTFPSLHLIANIDSIKTQPLHLTPQTVLFHGKIEADLSSTNPDDLVGKALLTHAIVVNDGTRFTFDSLQVNADNTNGIHSLSLKSDFLSFNIKGQYKLTQLADVFQQAIDPYFSLGGAKNTAKVDPYNFTITGGAVENEALKALMPGITRMKTVNLTAHFASDSGWNAFISAPYTVYNGMVIDNLTFNAATKNGALTFNTSLNQFKSGSSLAIFATTLNGSLQNNNLDFTLNIKDAKSVNKYTVSGTLGQPSLNNYSFSLKPGNLLLNYSNWNVNNGNSIQFTSSGDITANNFVLTNAAQQLSINSVGSGTNKPLSVDFKNFSIATLTGFVQNDSLLVNGTLNGNAVVKNFKTEPVFTSDLTVNDLSVYKDTLGNLSMKVNNSVANTYNADVHLTGRGNDVSVTGNYYLKPTNSTYDFTLNMASFQMKSLEGLTKGGIRDARGNMYGKVLINGSLDKPNIDGKINFNNTAFVASSLNNVFKIDGSSIALVKNEGILFNNFSIHDTANNAIVIDGALNSSNFLDYTFNLKIKADNFQAINSTKRDNRLFYGKMVFSTNLNITGTPANPVVDGSLTVNDKTDFTVVLPQAEPGVVEREGIVRFVDYSATKEDSIFMVPYDSLNKSAFQGYNISVNINVNKDAIFNLIVDEANGDFLRLKGEGQFTTGIDESGKITMVGSYEISEGAYELSFNFLKRKFSIQKGSRIVWTGEPTTADVSVTAVYIANTAPYDLVSTGGVTDATYRQKIPFEVHLGINGELMKPQITFDIVLPEDKNYYVADDVLSTVRQQLILLREEPGELNKQVFALLLLNRFVNQNPFGSSGSGGGGLDATTFARESVSRLLTEQLNQLASGLIQGVDINFDVASTDDYTTGSLQQRTDLNVGLTKRLLSDRLTITVGTDFELQGTLTPANQQNNNTSPNIDINYKLSRDGRYMLRAYRKNDYTGELEGYVIETGVGFIISVDYNKFKQIFARRKPPKKPKEPKTTDANTTEATSDNVQPTPAVKAK